MNENQRPIELEEYVFKIIKEFPELEQIGVRLEALLWKEEHPLREFWRQYFARIRRFRFDQ